MKSRSQLPPEVRTSSSKARAGFVLRGLELTAVVGLIAGATALLTRDSEFRAQQRDYEARAQAISAKLDLTRESADAEIESLKTSLAVIGDSARAREEILRQELDRASAALGAQERRLTQLTGVQEERLAKSETAFGTRLEELAMQLASERVQRTTAADRFRTIQEQSDDSVYLIHCVFTYETKEFDDEWKEHQATTWGTAFAVSDDGLLITNKHLVMPWKFDSELSALKAMGEVRIREDSVRLGAWPVGTVCLDSGKKANFSGGFNSDRATLMVAATAEDHMSDKSVEMAGKTVKYQMHALDNHDLALLKIAGATKALRLMGADATRLKTLDPVMAIGFPRGVGGLESTSAIPSATLGAVRKIEDTIHISAPIVAGNSGGPVFDAQGGVIGIATRIYCETLGICIKAEHAKQLVDRARVAKHIAIAASVPGK